jgi:hypothetical protein
MVQAEHRVGGQITLHVVAEALQEPAGQLIQEAAFTVVVAVQAVNTIVGAALILFQAVRVDQVQSVSYGPVTLVHSHQLA